MTGNKQLSRRGFGGVYLPTYKDRHTRKLRKSSIWWIQYSVHGQRKIENSHSRNRSDALKLLKKRLREIAEGRLIVSAVDKTRFEDHADMLIHDYEINGRRSLARAKRSVRHLGDFFGLRRAMEITSDRVSAYIALRKRQAAANATINRELAALKRMFRLGKRCAKVAEIPYISLLQEDNVRKGFFEREQLEAVLAHLPQHLKPVAEVAYITGWRVTSEILPRQWQNVDFTGGLLRLEPGETKNRGTKLSVHATSSGNSKRTTAADRRT